MLWIGGDGDGGGDGTVAVSGGHEGNSGDGGGGGAGHSGKHWSSQREKRFVWPPMKKELERRTNEVGMALLKTLAGEQGQWKRKLQSLAQPILSSLEQEALSYFQVPPA